jgi:tetratricopeptide (TPR) repeat protein
MLVTGWRGGDRENPTYGMRIRLHDRAKWFRQDWKEVLLYLPDQDSPITVSITPGFWRKCSELRSTAISRFLLRHRLAPWPPRRPPDFELEPLGEARFRLKEAQAARGEATVSSVRESRDQASGFRAISRRSAEAKNALLANRIGGERLFAQLVREHPEDGMVYFQRAQAYEALREPRRAARDFRRAAALFPAEDWRQKAREGLSRVTRGRESEQAERRQAHDD